MEHIKYTPEEVKAKRQAHRAYEIEQRPFLVELDYHEMIQEFNEACDRNEDLEKFVMYSKYREQEARERFLKAVADKGFKYSHSQLHQTGRETIIVYYFTW